MDFRYLKRTINDCIKHNYVTVIIVSYNNMMVYCPLRVAFYYPSLTHLRIAESVDVEFGPGFIGLHPVITQAYRSSKV